MYRPAGVVTGAEPLTVQDAAGHVRADAVAEAAYLDVCITAAREEAERATGRALVQREWELVLDKFPSGAIEINKVPVDTTTIVVNYTDPDGTATVLAADQYVVVNGEPLRIAPKTSWPTTLNRIGAVVVRFTAGAGGVPEILKAAMRLHVGDLYAHREETVVGQAVAPIGAVSVIYDRHRVGRWYA